MAVQSSFFPITQEDTKTFTSTKHIPTKQLVAVWSQNATTNVWTQVPSADFDLVTNSVILNTGVSPSLVSQIEVRVADSEDELTQSQSDISIVAGIATEVETVADNIAGIDAIYTNLNEILLADDNATAAAASASAALTSANNASTSETNASNSASAASTSASNASTSESNALTSANNASTSESNALTSANNAGTSETNAANSAIAAANSASSVNANLIVHTDNSGLPNEISTLISSVHNSACSIIADHDATLAKTPDATETSDTTTAVYQVGNYVYNSTSGILYECILVNTIGILLTNATYFTAVTSNTLSYTYLNAIYSNGLGDGGYQLIGESSTSGTIDFSSASGGVNYVAKELSLNSFLFSNERPTYDGVLSNVFNNTSRTYSKGLWYKPSSTIKNRLSTLDILGDGSCVACFPFDGNANDLGGVYNATNTGGTFTDGMFGQGLEFNATGERCILPDTLASTITNEISFSGRFKFLDLTTDIDFLFTMRQDKTVQFKMNSDNLVSRLELEVRNSGGTFSEIGDYANDIEVGKFYQLGFTIDSSNQATIYKDGVPIITGALSGFDYDFNDYIAIGHSTVSNPSFVADQVRIFNKALTDAEMFKAYLESSSSEIKEQVPNALSWFKQPYQVVNGTPQILRDDIEPLPEMVSDGAVFTGVVQLNKNQYQLDFGEIFAGNKLTKDFPIPNTDPRDWIVRAEINIGTDKWTAMEGSTGNATANTGTFAFSVKEGIVVRAGNSSVIQYNNTGEVSSGYTDNVTLSSAPCRVIATYIGGINV